MLSAQIAIQLRDEVADLRELTAFVADFARQNRLPPPERDRLTLILEELLTNVVAHGYGALAHGHIEVALSLRGSRIVIEFVDDGRAFDPRAHHDEFEVALNQHPGRGLGLTIVRSLSDQIAYARRGGRNYLTLTRNLRDTLDET